MTSFLTSITMPDSRYYPYASDTAMMSALPLASARLLHERVKITLHYINYTGWSKKPDCCGDHKNS